MTDTRPIEAPPAQEEEIDHATAVPRLDSWPGGNDHAARSRISFLCAPELRESGPYVISQFIGGIAPAIFLFLTGVTLAFMMHGMERKAASRKDRLMTALRRAAYLGVLAFAFRIQLFLFG